LTPVYICAYNAIVDCQWDPAKAEANFTKHGIHFADAVSVLEDDLALTIRDSSSEEEERWVTLGMDSLGRILVAVYIWRDERIRLISARLSTPQERRQYTSNSSPPEQ
jgi:uncharacterized protein